MVSFGCKKGNIPHYTISRLVKSDTASKLTININSRLNQAQLLAIATKVKADSAKLPKLQINYLLSGHSDKGTGLNNYYAVAKYPDGATTNMQDTLKDDDGNIVRLKVNGLSAQIAKKLINLNPKEIEGKTVLGRYVDDNNQTLIVPFMNKAGTKTEIYVIELDTTGKVVSATVPVVVVKDGVKKLLVTQHGDYITIKDSLLTQYAVDDFGLPYNSIRSGL